jgi:enterochelin esterase-like enzyme
MARLLVRNGNSSFEGDFEMSIWTHVLGAVRIDSLPGFPKLDIGKTCTFDDDEKAWDECDVPCGSEGSLNVLVWENPHKSSLAKYTVTVFGDLRDYDDKEEIIQYFNRIIKNQMIREAFFVIDVEGSEPDKYHYDGVSEEFVKIGERT